MLLQLITHTHTHTHKISSEPLHQYSCGTKTIQEVGINSTESVICTLHIASTEAMCSVQVTGTFTSPENDEIPSFAECRLINAKTDACRTPVENLNVGCYSDKWFP
jgi:hypothetical protein